MPRVLHVLGSLNPGGVERWLRDLTRLADASPWRFDFCLLGEERGTYAAGLEALGSRVLSCTLRPRSTFAVRLYALLVRERYDAVHSHVHQFSGLVVGAAHAAGVPVRAAHSHTCGPEGASYCRRLYGMAMRTLLQRSMTVGFACSENAGAFAGPNVRSRLRIVPCGIDLEAFRRPRPDRARLRGALGLPEDVPILGHVGRLAPEKNHAFLLRVAARLIRDVPRLRLVIAGGGERTALEGLGRRLGLRQRVVFTGPRDDVPDLLGGVFDALALPSLREGLPGVVLEAQAAGLACVVSEHTPAEAVVAPELVETVWLNQGAGPWAAALGRALGKPRADREDACSRLRERGFDAATSFRVLTETYEEGLAAAPAGSGLGRAYGARALGRGSS